MGRPIYFQYQVFHWGVWRKHVGGGDEMIKWIARYVVRPPTVRVHQHRSGLNITAQVGAEEMVTYMYLNVSKFRNPYNIKGANWFERTRRASFSASLRVQIRLLKKRDSMWRDVICGAIVHSGLARLNRSSNSLRMSTLTHEKSRGIMACKKVLYVSRRGLRSQV
jgi:hypothetical protein